ncbi:MAG: IclR family transcriptional regulator [Burkholderiales bacterium]|nr:IclR family transcriptional regulator [Burkholderiales bacterium]
MMRSVQRILAIFESFTPTETCLALHQIAQRIELPKSTTFRLLQSLEQAGYLMRLEDQRYCLSFRFTRLAGLVRSTMGIREVARPIMRELAAATSETVTLHTSSAGMRVCIDAVATASPLRSVTQPGEQAPLTVGSSSKVLLAFADDRKAVASAVARIAKLGERSQADVEAELARIRKQGYAVSHGERVVGVCAIAAPVRGLDDGQYALSVVGPMVRMRDKEKDFAKLVVRAAADISWLLGGQSA